MHESNEVTDVNGAPSAPQPPRVWTSFLAVFVGLVLAILLQAIMVIVLAGVLNAKGVKVAELPNELANVITSPGMFCLTLVLGQLGFAIATLLAGRFSPEPLLQRFGFLGVRLPAKLYLLVILGSVFVLAIAAGCSHLVAMAMPGDETVAKLFEKMTPLWGIVFVTLIALLPGLIEETLFRGYIQTRFLKRWRPFWAILAASSLFALVHVTPHAIAVAFPLGVWFGYLAWRTNSIWPGIACHAFVNGGINIWRLVVKFAELSDTTVYVCNAIFALIGVVGFVLALKILATYRPVAIGGAGDGMVA